MAAYRAHWQEVEKAYAKNSIEGTDIKKTSVGPARLAIEKSVKSARENGQAVKGSPELSNLTVTKADLNRDVAKVHLSSCLDVSEWVIYNKSTGEPVPQPSDRLTKYTVTSLLEKWPDGWVVTKDEPHQDTQC
ncbi:secreted protein/lipoprotein [Streptomyces albidoflavus]|nr:secreted protein/lipoprotein [Streptomyces albidoflavus]